VPPKLGCCSKIGHGFAALPAGSLVADPSTLMSRAWVPPLSTPVGLYRLMEANVA
jgi:hypothetical protein